MKNRIRGTFVGLILIACLVMNAVFSVVVSAEGEDSTEISVPSIYFIDKELEDNVDEFAVSGGETIYIRGANFQQGAQVVFNPEYQIKGSDDSQTVYGEIYRRGVWYDLIGGEMGTNVSVTEDGGSIEVTTPASKVGPGTLLVINPDYGASALYDLRYVISQVNAPNNIWVQAIDDAFVVTWSKVADAREYEVYVTVNGENNSWYSYSSTPEYYLGSTKYNYFIYKDIHSDQRYRFMVKTVGELSTSEKYEVSEWVRAEDALSSSSDDTSETAGSLNGTTVVQQAGKAVTVSFGAIGYTSNRVIDLRKPEFLSCEKVVINLPASVIKDYRGNDIQVIGKDFEVGFDPGAVFNTTNMDRDHDGIRVEILPVSDSGHLEAGSIALSKQYSVKASEFRGDETNVLNTLQSGITVKLNYDTVKTQLRRLDNLKMARYNEDSGIWESIESGRDGEGNFQAETNKTGRYMIIGSRN